MTDPTRPSTPPRGRDLRTRRLQRTTRLVLGVAGVPSAALVTIGILVWATGNAVRDVVIGILVIGMAATVATGVVVTSILLARETELARLQSEFVSRVSHDLRTPLTSIRMFVETLQMGRVRDERATHEVLEALGTETARLLAMVERLLAFAQIESARREFPLHRARVADLVDRALVAFDAQHVQAPVAVEKLVPDTLPDVEVDADAIVEALLNLLQNAFNYTGDEKKIAVRVRAVAGDVEIAVMDNGIGVSPDETRKIFERFYRGSAARMHRVAGTGLGLAMVRAVVAAHDGKVRVQANAPVGSVFTVVLPVAGSPR